MWPFKSMGLTDNQQRLGHFSESMKDAPWNSNQRQALEQLARQLNVLAYDDVLYYIRVRNKHRGWSTVTRAFALFFGTIGLLTPLVVSAKSELKEYAGWGYPALALAGAFLWGNRLFGSTTGHIRYATAQFALEHLIVQFNLRWYAWQTATASRQLTEADTSSAFELFSDFINAAYKIVQEETTVWGTTLMQDLESYRKKMAGADDAGEAGAANNPRPDPAPRSQSQSQSRPQ